ncbi:MAG TPA: universal stress protein [Gammaproteobacteria bacterium]|nr:universal stress protein [Gammaproteobacteria bacterium]
MTAFRRILVVIDPTTATQPGLERGARLAKQLGAKLELFICDYNPLLTESRALDAGAVARARAALLDSDLRRLHELAAPLQSAGLDVTVAASWDHPLHEGIVRKTVESGADIVVKDTHYHSVLKRSIFSNTDWSLIRGCPAALLLVKPRATAAKPCVVAAIDPLHERDAQASLDKRILATAVSLASALGGELQVFHAFDITPVIAASSEAMMTPIALPINEITDAMREEHTDAVHALTDEASIPRERVHIHQGGARDGLVGLTDRLRADVVVMGAVSRSGLERLFVGSTAEEVLDKLACDVLIVKARGFVTAP